ncbi:MAG: hypothetical protein FWH43_03480 [Endomicrobia bacterium]|nr:hypothetical protein [Endomicrobiia bacterium]
MLKKIFLFFALAILFPALCNAELNLKTGVDILGKLNFMREGSGISVNANTGFSFCGEYFIPVSQTMKIGAGTEYQLPRESSKMAQSIEVLGKIESYYEFNYMPVYFSAQINANKDYGLYFKGNLGYCILHDVADNININNNSSKNIFIRNASGGLYFAVGGGYEFDSGIIIDILYSYYSGSFDYGLEGYFTTKFESVYKKFGLNIGYKFKI